MKVSVVIPAFNEAKLLPATLAAVARAQTALGDRGWTTETIVCDNNSTDGTGDLARAAGATVVVESVNQIGRARNTGAAAATGNWLIFVDADSEPSVQLFAAVADLIATRRVLAGGALIALPDAPAWARLVAEGWAWWSRLARHMAGAFIFVETAAFRELGGFSPTLYAGEEIDLSQRLKALARQRGLRVHILAHPRLHTSARKANLYSPREALGFVVRAVFRPKKTLSSREACHLWYDGRR